MLWSGYPSARVGTDQFRGSGTSQSAAVVSGAAALLFQRWPNATPDTMKELLTRTATPLRRTTTAIQGRGELNVAAAMATAPLDPSELGRPAAAASRGIVNHPFSKSTGVGSLELARGTHHVVMDGVVLLGERDIMGAAWTGALTALLTRDLRMWSGNGSFNGNQWIGEGFTPDTVTAAGRAWGGRSWAGRSWAGRSWAGSLWSGRSWASRVWNGRSWAGQTLERRVLERELHLRRRPEPEPGHGHEGPHRPHGVRIVRRPTALEYRLMALTRPGARATTFRVVALAAVLAAAGGIPLLLEPASVLLLEGPDALPWWMLAALFAVTEACALRARVGRSHLVISLSEVPLVMGLFLAEPLHLLAARLLGVAVVLAVRRRQPLPTVLLTLGLATAGTAIALVTFAALLGDADPLGVRGCLAALAAAAVGGLLDVAAVTLVTCWYGDRPAVLEALRVTAVAVAVPALVGIVGVVPVLAFSHGEAALPVAVTGGVALLGYRAFAVLADRHASLGRLYELSDALAVAPASSDVVTSLLRQSRRPAPGRLRRGHARRARPEGAGLVAAALRRRPLRPRRRRARGPGAAPRPAWSPVRPGHGPEARAFLAARDVTEALVVPLRIDDRVTGHLLVADRIGVDRTF